jgi:hypothetical protein
MDDRIDVNAALESGRYEQDGKYVELREDSTGTVFIMEPRITNAGFEWLGVYAVADRSQLSRALRNHFARLSRPIGD